MGKIAIIGGFGSIGRRYVSICSYLGIPFSVYDVNGKTNRDEVNKFLDRSDPEKALICTPTDTHTEYCTIMVDRGLPFMCEKPVSKDFFEVTAIAKMVKRKNVSAFVVNNYNFLLQRIKKKTKNSYATFTDYSYYNTGKDGVLFDCCQLVYINPMITISVDSPIWILKAGDISVNYREVELSYISMIEAWENQDYFSLWSMDEGAAMTEAVLDRMIDENPLIEDAKGLQ